MTYFPCTPLYPDDQIYFILGSSSPDLLDPEHLTPMVINAAHPNEACQLWTDQSPSGSSPFLCFNLEQSLEFIEFFQKDPSPTLPSPLPSSSPLTDGEPEAYWVAYQPLSPDGVMTIPTVQRMDAYHFSDIEDWMESQHMQLISLLPKNFLLAAIEWMRHYQLGHSQGFPSKNPPTTSPQDYYRSLYQEGSDLLNSSHAQ